MSHDPNQPPFEGEVCQEIGIVNTDDPSMDEVAVRCKELVERYLVEPVFTEEELIKRGLEHRSRVSIKLCGYDMFDYPPNRPTRPTISEL